MFFDTHAHTVNSPDGSQTVFELCEDAVQKKLKGVTITEHADFWIYPYEEIVKKLSRSYEQCQEAKKIYGDKLEIFTGVEIGEYFYDVNGSERLKKSKQYDVILGSCHAISIDGKFFDFYYADCGESVSEQELIDRVNDYYDRYFEIADKADVDVMTHLTYPFRYINGKYNRGLSVELFYPIIDKILKRIVKRELALELNTSSINSYYGKFVPDKDVLRRYIDFGGNKISLASDSHCVGRIGNAFDDAAKLLHSLGIDKAVYFKNRTPIYYDIQGEHL